MSTSPSVAAAFRLYNAAKTVNRISDVNTDNETLDEQIEVIMECCAHIMSLRTAQRLRLAVPTSEIGTSEDFDPKYVSVCFRFVITPTNNLTTRIVDEKARKRVPVAIMVVATRALQQPTTAAIKIAAEKPEARMPSITESELMSRESELEAKIDNCEAKEKRLREAAEEDCERRRKKNKVETNFDERTEQLLLWQHGMIQQQNSISMSMRRIVTEGGYAGWKGFGDARCMGKTYADMMEDLADSAACDVQYLDEWWSSG